MSNARARIGATLAGGFRLLDVLTEDGRGVVYRAEQNALARSVAIRIVPPILTEGARADRLEAALRAASRLAHPNVAAVLDVGRTAEREVFVVTELAAGTPLSDLRAAAGVLLATRALALGRQILAALGAAHALGIVHGAFDARAVWVEPMLPRGELVRVAGLGLATLDAPPAPPEDDVFATAALLLELVTGEDARAAIARGVVDPRALAPMLQVPPRIAEVVARALHPERGQRISTAAAFDEALREATDAVTEVRFARRVAASPPGGGSLACAACHAIVPSRAYCGKCGSRLPIRSLVPQAATPEFPLTLLGRDEDLAWLDDRLARAAAGFVGARIVGEPGSGRTRLLDELAVRAAQSGHEVVTIGPSSAGVPIPYDALRRAIVALARIDEVALADGAFPGALPDTRRALVEIVLGVRAERDTRTEHERRHASAGALRWALQRAGGLARGAPFLLAVDDLDELDWPSRTAIADVVGDAPAHPALLVATHAPGFDPGWPAENPARPIGGLPPELAALLVPAGSLGERVRASTDAGGRGVLPLYVEHLARLALAGGVGAPPRLGDLLALRVEALDAPARAALAALAVLGRAAPRGMLAALSARPAGLDHALDALEEAGLVVGGRDVVTFTHPRVREIVLAGLPSELRRALHERALTLLDGRDVPPEVRAEHAYYAAAMPLALRLADEVAAEAERLGDTGVALASLRRAAELARRDAHAHPSDAAWPALLFASLRLADLLTATGHFREAEQTLDGALAVTPWAAGNRLLLFERCARLAAARHRDADAQAFLEIALALAVEENSEAAAARVAALERDLGLERIPLRNAPPHTRVFAPFRKKEHPWPASPSKTASSVRKTGLPSSSSRRSAPGRSKKAPARSWPERTRRP